MRQVLEPGKSIPVVESADVVVCGGGPAGLIAAVAAARNGADTILIERCGFLGGAATQSLVSPISKFNFGGRRIIGGIPLEFIEALKRRGGAVTDYASGNVPFDPEIYKLVAEEMVAEAGVKLSLYTQIAGVIGKDSEPVRITHALVENKSGRLAVEGKYFIDCTGDADLVKYAGLPYKQGDPASRELQPMTLWFRLGGVATERLENMYPEHDDVRYYNQRISELLKDLASRQSVPNFGGPWFYTNLRANEVTVNITRFAGDGTDAASMTAAECSLRKDMFQLVGLLKAYVSEFQNCFLIDSGAQVGVRETRRIVGDYEMTADDILNPKNFQDTVAKGAHPIDIHRSEDNGQDVTFIKREFNIPYRSLIPRGSVNLLAAGRCVASTRQANAAIRVQATCMALGQAAGTAAAVCKAKSIDCGALKGETLRELLESQRAIVQIGI